jgi:hypothetical protein
MMAWTLLSPTLTPATWNVTDTELLNRIIYHLLENGNADANGTLLTSMFTVQEIIAAMNTRQQRFLKDTAAILTRASEAVVPQTARYALPADWIYTRRITYQPFQGTVTALTRTDAYELDHGLPDWQQNFADSTVYNDGSDLPTLTVEIAKAPQNAGNLTLMYVAQPVTLTGAGTLLSIPDEYESAILFGTLADLLSSEGEGTDSERASYCEMRYQICVDMTIALITGAAPQQAQQQNGGQGA